jgi:integrase
LKLLEYNPVDSLRVWSTRKKVVEAVDRRVVAAPRQVRELLTAVTYVGRRGKVRRGELLRAFFGFLYFAVMRPGEAINVRETDFYLPEPGAGVQ